MEAESPGGNPWDYPEWHGFARETKLSVGLICAGVNGIGRATYADLGEYYVAFFGISNGIERLGKLVCAVDTRIDQGSSPTEKQLRRLGHKLEDIVASVRRVEHRRALPIRYPYPQDEFTGAIITALAMFADAARGRYANFETIGGTTSPFDPVTNWWQNVVDPILDRHFRGTKKEQQADANAKLAEGILGQSSVFLHHTETAQRMDSLYAGSMRTAENDVAQKYGRYYILRLVRWMSDVFTAILGGASRRRPDPVLFGHDELVRTFRVSDDFLLNRKRWPLS